MQTGHGGQQLHTCSPSGVYPKTANMFENKVAIITVKEKGTGCPHEC
jgi:hypothetical protein